MSNSSNNSALSRAVKLTSQVNQINTSRKSLAELPPKSKPVAIPYEPLVSYDSKTGAYGYKVPKAQPAPSEEKELRKKGDSINLYQNKKEVEEDQLLDDLADEYDEDYEEEEEDDEEDEEEYDDEDDDFIVDDDDEIDYDEDGVEDELEEEEKKIAVKKRVELEPFKRVVTYYRRRPDGKLEAIPAAETAKVEPEKSNDEKVLVVEEKKQPEEETTDAKQ
jgi:hypothetical protein